MTNLSFYTLSGVGLGRFSLLVGLSICSRIPENKEYVWVDGSELGKIRVLDKATKTFVSLSENPDVFFESSCFAGHGALSVLHIR